jgi:hypothetical protein
MGGVDARFAEGLSCAGAVDMKNTTQKDKDMEATRGLNFM